MEIETDQFQVHETEQQTEEAPPGWSQQVQVVVQAHHDVFKSEIEVTEAGADHFSPGEEAPVSPEAEVCDDLNIADPSDELKQHSVNVNTVGTTFKCSKCKRKFRNPHLLQQHLRLHRTSAPTTYKCSECQETFPDLAGFMQHRETHPRKKKKRENVPIGLFDGKRNYR